jgi:ATP-dependent DNA helicase RecG
MEQLSISFPKHSAMLSPDEIYGAMDERLLQLLKEDKRLERKPPGFHCNALGDYISMWANTAPEGGLMILGIENDGRLTGCHKLSVDQVNNLEKAQYTFCADARVDSKRVAITAEDGSPSFVIAMRVRYREDKVAMTVSGHAFIRRGDSKHELNQDEIRELEIDRGQTDLEAEGTLLSFPEDFDPSLIRRFVDGVARVHQTSQIRSDAEAFAFRRLGVLKNGKLIPNNACVLGFARNPLDCFPGCQIRFLRVDGEFEQSGDKYNIRKSLPMEGPVPLLLEQAFSFISSQLRDFSRLGEDGLFYGAPEYPQAAWYEALVNACVHRSYGLKNMNVFVKMFDDKLVIESPGGFPPLVTPQNIYETHHPRNPRLMRAMFYMDLVKEHSEGTKRMRDTMKEMRLPAPAFEQVKTDMGFSQVKVTLRNDVKQRKVLVDVDVTSVIGEALSRNLSQEEKRVLNFVAEHGKINVIQCHKLLPSVKKWHGAKRILTNLSEKGLLRHIHSKTVVRDSRAYYVLPEVMTNGTPRKKG